ncbi:UDP-3-O-(3-hydroxymyristoyl)glucosamine N-acyltransferase [Ectothiorhodospiraceae bacterium 2226]|nr:UDP-3-O-(3-hydroxymyristoyl)glucosamine N-acyltransferase [Ectothiorhodospiraceae bacterium 2226]
MKATYTLAELAQHAGVELRGAADVAITGVGTLSGAGPSQITFLTNRRYAAQLPATRAGAVVLTPLDAASCPTNALLSDNPHATYARIASLFAEVAHWSPGIHPTAVIAPDARIDPSASIAAHCTVESEAVVEAGVRLGPSCVIGRRAHIGDHSHLVAQVTVSEGCALGARVLLHPGVVIGADGFGLANDNGVWIKVPQLGTVRIGNDVEIGANTTVDRGAIDDTVIEDGVKIDNLVQVAHNCRIGAHTVIAGCAGIAGSTLIGRHCAVGGGAGIGGHLSIPDGVTLTGMAMVTKSPREAGVYSSGLPAEPNAQWHRTVAHIRQLPSLLRRVKALEAALQNKPADDPADNG